MKKLCHGRSKIDNAGKNVKEAHAEKAASRCAYVKRWRHALYTVRQGPSERNGDAVQRLPIIINEKTIIEDVSLPI